MATAHTAARHYAQAYFALAADAGDIEGWRRELAGAVQTLGNPDVAAALDNPRTTVQARAVAVLEILDGTSTPVRNLVRLLVERKRSRLAPELLVAYDRLADQASGVIRAEVLTAVPVDPTLERHISETLRRHLGGGDVRTVVTPDPTIIGGLIVRVGDRVIDSSVSTRLTQLQAALA